MVWFWDVYRWCQTVKDLANPHLCIVWTEDRSRLERLFCPLVTSTKGLFQHQGQFPAAPLLLFTKSFNKNWQNLDISLWNHTTIIRQSNVSLTMTFYILNVEKILIIAQWIPHANWQSSIKIPSVCSSRVGDAIPPQQQAHWRNYAWAPVCFKWTQDRIQRNACTTLFFSLWDWR